MAESDDVLRKGARVRLNSLSVARHPRDARKEGTVVGLSQYPTPVSVLWSFRRSPVAIHRGYLKTLESGGNSR
jgi:hypothetical protein